MAEESREVRETRPVWEAEVPWVVAYLREDIQDLKGDIREIRRSIERLDAKLNARIDELDAKFDAKIDELDAKFDAKIDELDVKFDAKIDELDAKFDTKIEGLRREMGVQFRWLLGTMVAVGALIVAALKLLP